MQAQSPQQSRPHILIVDDEIRNVNLLTDMLEADYNVTGTRHGKEALVLVKRHKFDAVLLDIMLPDLTGTEVLKVIRRSHSKIELPVILVSAIVDQRHIAEGFKLGANDYITKPIDLNVVLVRVAAQTALKQMNDERQRVISSLQVANKMQARMMQVASHDLKNPLNNLRMLTTVMRRKPPENGQLMEMLEMLDDSLDSMLGVVEDFLDGAFTDEMEMTVNLGPIKSVPIIRQVLNQYAVTAYNKGITIVADDIDGTVLADASRLAQVVSNLLSNAIKYTPPDSRVVLRTDCDRGVWRLTVQDEGPGIPADEIEHLFKPFSKISTEATGGEGSTGLGLWIVQEMMTLQEGRVGCDCDSAPGGRFWIELPLLAEVAAGK